MNNSKQTTNESLRFKFGKNWQNFLTTLNDERINEAKKSLLTSLNKKTLKGLRFLDIGSGSGLFSLAATQLGALVHSFDYDYQSVACTQYLKQKYEPLNTHWVIEQGSVLDEPYLDKLGQFDIVYSWGVLHHTGNMKLAFENVIPSVKQNGFLFISIYNDQGGASKRWAWIKKNYNKSNFFIKCFFLIYTLYKQWHIAFIKDFVSTGNPFKQWSQYKKNRGMSPYYDLIDWVGGYPFEVAKPEDIFDFFKNKGFSLIHLKTCGGGLGCNEFIFQKNA